MTKPSTASPRNSSDSLSSDAAADVLVRARRVRHRVLEQPAVAEAVADRLLQRLELVAQPDDLPARELGAVALDDAPRLVGVVRREPTMRTSPSALTVSGNTDCGSVRRDDRRHAVRLEQPAHDARLDVGVRAEDDDQVSHERQRPPRRIRGHRATPVCDLPSCVLVVAA